MISSQYSKESDQLQFQALPATKTLNKEGSQKINLCSGPVLLDDYINIDITKNADIVLDLEKDLLPFPDQSIDIIVCISAINYFSRERAREIIKDIHRVLKPGGTTRFATQDLRVLAKNYIDNNLEFYSEKLPNGQDRFPGKSIGDKFNEFFYGFHCAGKHCKYVYDFESLKNLFEEAGFALIEQKKYLESRIPGIEKLDNRPGQMFFLEAVKGETRINFPSNKTSKSSGFQEHNNIQKTDTDLLYDLALNMWNTGAKDKAWQYLLKVLEVKPDNRLAVVKCIEILRSFNRFEDISKLCTDYLNLRPDDFEVKKMLEEAQNGLSLNTQNNDSIAQRRGEIIKLNQRFNGIQTDKVHLSACLKWLARAQDINDGGGVAASYNMDSKLWGVDYPETTGYIIPTFLGYYKLTREESYRKRATDMGDWEIGIQWPEGGIGEPVGVYGLLPRIFNTSQVILGWLALYTETSEDKYLIAAQKAAGWIIGNQDSDGKWTKNTYAGPKAYHIRVAWALLELYAITQNIHYRTAAERSVNWVLSQGYDNGWFANNSLSAPHKPWTHLIGYVLVGLLEICRLNNVEFDREKAFSLLYNAARALAGFYTKLKENNKEHHFATLPETFDNNWFSADNRSCLTGTAQIEFFLRRIYKYNNDCILKSASDLLIDDLKQLHLIDGITDPGVFGGLAGSYPIGAGYLGYAIPNWGVKFFADCLLQRSLTDNMQMYLG